MGKNRNKRYELNKSAKVGTEIKCPVCGHVFIKKSYQQAFCCGECKDRYHNQKRKDNGYFKRYNIEHSERLERIGIDINDDSYLDKYLGDADNESMGHITLDASCKEDEELERFSLDW